MVDNSLKALKYFDEVSCRLKLVVHTNYTCVSTNLCTINVHKVVMLFFLYSHMQWNTNANYIIPIADFYVPVINDLIDLKQDYIMWVKKQVRKAIVIF